MSIDINFPAPLVPRFDIGAYSYPEIEPAIERLNELLAADRSATEDKLKLAEQALFVLHDLVGEHISPHSPVAREACELIMIVLCQTQQDNVEDAMSIRNEWDARNWPQKGHAAELKDAAALRFYQGRRLGWALTINKRDLISGGSDFVQRVDAIDDFLRAWNLLRYDLRPEAVVFDNRAGGLQGPEVPSVLERLRVAGIPITDVHA